MTTNYYIYIGGFVVLYFVVYALYLMFVVRPRLAAAKEYAAKNEGQVTAAGISEFYLYGTYWGRLRKVMSHRLTVTLLVIALAGSVVGAFLLGGGVWFIAPFVCLYFAWLLIGHIARKDAQRDFFSRLAEELGFEVLEGPSEKFSSFGFCEAGDDREYLGWLGGSITTAGTQQPCELGLYTFEITRYNGRNSYTEQHQTTVLAVDLSDLKGPIVDVALRAGSWYVDSDLEWLAGNLEEVELESVEFNDSFSLKQGPTQDPVKLRELFSPAFIVKMLDLRGSYLSFECYEGHLLIYQIGHLQGSLDLLGFIEQARPIYEAISREAQELHAAA